jgi:flavin reductase ActVB
MNERTLDAARFRAAVRRFGSGVTVITMVDGEGKRIGFTATAFSLLSFDPPLVLVCLDKGAESHATFRSAPRYAVSILAEGQTAIAARFATKGMDKFEGVETVDGEATGLPLISGAAAHLECRLVERIAAGDHTILVGEAVRAVVTGRSPLLYLDRQFGRFVPDVADAADRAVA